MIYKDYIEILDYDKRIDGHKIPDKVIARGLVRFLRRNKYLDGKWENVDLRHDRFKVLDNFFDESGLTIYDTKRIIEDSYRREVFISEIESQGVTVLGHMVFTLIDMNSDKAEEVNRIYRQFALKLRRAIKLNGGELKINTFTPAPSICKQMDMIQQEFADLLDRKEDYLKLSGIKISQPNLDFEEIKVYSLK